MNIVHIHSMYSTFDSTSEPVSIVKKAKEMNCKSITLTDHDNLMGIEEFMSAGKEYDVNTIPGIEFSTISFENASHLVVFAKNYKGYQTICFALKEANLTIKKIGKIKKPIVSMDTLEKYFKDNPDVIATSACIQGIIASTLLKNFKLRYQEAKYKDETNKNQKAYEDCVSYENELIDVKQKIKDLKKEITSNNKASNATVKSRIEKLKAEIEVLSEKLNAYSEDEPAYFKIREKLEKKRDDLSTFEGNKNLAENNLPLMESELSSLIKRKSILEKQIKELSKYKNKYEKYDDLLKSITYFSEEDLYKEAKERLIELKSIFKNFYIEIQNHYIDEELYVMPLLVKLAKETNTPIIAANDAHMIDNSDDSIEARRVIRFNYFEKPQVVTDADKEMYLKSEEELYKCISDAVGSDFAKEAIENLSILDECKVVFPNETHYPKTNSEEFDKLLLEERQRRIDLGIWGKDYEERLNYEVSIIKKMGYVDYHLIVHDFCREGKKLGQIPKSEIKNIPEDFNEVDKWLKSKNFCAGIGIGHGRGSAAGSLVCFMLGITNLDPIKYDLLFERFLNPERVSLPDIDTDVKTSLRGTIIRYLKQKYGENAICSVGTISTYGAKSAIQMAGRELMYRLFDDDSSPEAKDFRKFFMGISDMIPEEPGAKIADSIEEIKKEYAKNPYTNEIVHNALLLEGKVSGTGLHAGGIVISDNDNISEYVPLAYNEDKSVWYTQCDKDRLEDKGLLKMDLLGLTTLDVMSDCVQLINSTTGEIIDLDNIPFEEEVFREIYSKGITNSVFQFESAGMKSVLTRFKPTCFEDLIILVSMFRPGPKQFIDGVIDVKWGNSEIKYLCPELEPILGKTYGAIVYQEQVMSIFQKLAGYTLGGADTVRRYMSKKKADKLAHEKNAFIYGDPEREIKGCINNGISEEVAEKLFEQMTEFSKYAFNKSHAAVYAWASYQTAWLKYHYPLQFLSAMFNNKDLDDYEPIFEDLNYFGIPLLQPDINHSSLDFIIEKKCIRYGLCNIKGIGNANLPLFERIIANRPYKSFNEFLFKNIFDGEKIDIPDKKIIESFANVGVFDSLHPNRNSIHDAFSKMNLQKSDSEAEIKRKINETEVVYYPADKYLNWEKEVELLGKIVSENPLSNFHNEKKYGCSNLSELSDYNGNTDLMGFIMSAEETKNFRGDNVIELKALSKSGLIFKIILQKALYAKYTGEMMKSLIHQTLKVNGFYNGRNVLYANNLSRLNANSIEYALDVKTEDTFNVVLSALNQRSDDCFITLHAFFYFLDENGETKVDIRKYEVDQNFVAVLKSKNIQLEKYNPNSY